MFKYSLNTVASCSGLQKSGPILTLPWSPIAAHYAPHSPAKLTVLLFLLSDVSLFPFSPPPGIPPIIFMFPSPSHMSSYIIFQDTVQIRIK